MNEVSASGGTLAIKASNVATYGGAGTAFVGGLSANEFAAIGGLVVAVFAAACNLVLTWYFKREHLRLERRKLSSAEADACKDCSIKERNGA